MRDFRDAKTMARDLRRSLAGHGLDTTHSQALELIAQAFGFDNWNILAARIEAAQPAASGEKPATEEPMRCSFCGKSQHEVKTLIAGPGTFICNACVAMCDDVIADNEVLTPLRDEGPDADPEAELEALLAAYTAEQLRAYLARARKNIGDEQGTLDGLDGDGEGLPAYVQSLDEPAKARTRARLASQLALRRRSVEIVARVLAARE